MTDDTLINAECVSKKFCRSLKKSLWYGVKDLGNEIVGRRHGGDGSLRPHEFWALRDVSFKLQRGDCLGLIGQNGAGKTTLLRILNGLIKPDAGQITIKGRVGALIALGAGFNPILTGRENIYVNAAVLGLSRREIKSKLDEIIDFADIGDFLDTPVQNYSSGMQVRLGFAIASAITPDVLFLDEVLAVGDAAFQVKCLNRISDLQKMGVGSILVSHNLVNIFQYSTKCLLLSKGKVEYLGSVDAATTSYLNNTMPITQSIESGNVPTDSGFELDKIYVTDRNNKPLGDIPPLAPIRLHVPYRIGRGLDFEHLLFSLGINDIQGVYYHGFSSPLVIKRTAVDSSGEIVVSIDSLRAASGRLTIGVAAWGFPGKKLLAWSKDNSFTVQYEASNAGRVLLGTDWMVV